MRKLSYKFNQKPKKPKTKNNEVLPEGACISLGLLIKYLKKFTYENILKSRLNLNIQGDL